MMRGVRTGAASWQAFLAGCLPILLLLVSLATGLSSKATTPQPSKVLVTGASGKTGKLVFANLLQESALFEPVAMVRSEKSAKALQKAVPATRLDQIVVCDVVSLLDDNDDSSSPLAGHDGFESMIICTSAMPVIRKRCLALALLKIPWNLIRGKKAVDFRSFRFVWKAGQYPEKVDYEGQKAQIDLAKKIGIQQVVVVGSMGGTDSDNFLNAVGKRPDGSGNGDILLWKRKAEKYLVESGLDHVIIHPGGLTDSDEENEEFVLDVDDKLLDNKKRCISRANVARLCVAALKVAKGEKIALDCISRPTEKEGAAIQSAEEALQAFLKEGKVYNYAL